MCQQPEATQRLTLKPRTTKEEALMTGEQHPIPALTPPNCHLNSAYNKCQVLLVSHPAHNPPKVSHIFTAFRKFHGFHECNAHNKHSSLRWHCTYCHFQFHKCHFSLFHRFTGKHSGWSKPRTQNVIAAVKRLKCRKKAEICVCIKVACITMSSCYYKITYSF